jgi:hypothetical protein
MSLTFLAPTTLPQQGRVMSAAIPFSLDLAIRTNVVNPSGLTQPVQATLLVSQDAVTFYPAEHRAHKLFAANSYEVFQARDYATQPIANLVTYSNAGIPTRTTWATKNVEAGWEYAAVLFDSTLGGSCTVSATADSGIIGGTPLAIFTDGPTINLDLDLARNWEGVLGGNRALTMTNGWVGQSFFLTLQQDATGSRTITSWFAGVTIDWAGGSAPTLTTTPGKRDMFGFVQLASGVWSGHIVGQNI